MRYRVIAKFDNETRIYEDKMYSLLDHTEAEWIEMIKTIYNTYDDDSARLMITRALDRNDFTKLIQVREIWYNMQERKSKMTREEAIKQMKPSRWYGEDGMQGWLLDNLQALGLIKFEEELTPTMHSSIPKSLYDRFPVCIEQIEEAGYKIVRK